MVDDPSEQSPSGPAGDGPADDEASAAPPDEASAGAGEADPHGSPGEADATAETGAAEQPEPDVAEFTTGVRTLDPAVRWLWIGRAVMIGLFLGGVVAGIALAIAPGLAWAGAVAFALVAGLGALHAVLLYRSWEYRIREDSVYLHRGVLTKVRTVVPYVRVQHIDTSRGPIERAAGLSTLVIYTAGSRGADVTIPGLVPAEAGDLQTRLKVLAIESEGEDAV